MKNLLRYAKKGYIKERIGSFQTPMGNDSRQALKSLRQLLCSTSQRWDRSARLKAPINTDLLAQHYTIIFKVSRDCFFPDPAVLSRA